MTMYLILWGVVFVAAAVAEVLSLQLISIWFAVGAGGAFTAALCGCSLITQLIVFVSVSVVLLLVTRPLLKKLRVSDTPALNADRGIGKTAVVIEEINAAYGTGRARIDGVDWMAVSEDDSVIPNASIVTVTGIEGAKLIVRPVPEASAYDA